MAEQINNQVLFSSDEPKPKTVKNQPQVNGDVSFEQTLKQTFPEYQGMNSLYIRKQLNTDNEFFDEVADKLFRTSRPEDEMNELITDQEKFELERNKFKKGFRSFVTKRSYTGKTSQESLVERTVQTTEDNIPFQDYVAVVEKNKKKYKKAGLIDEDGQFVFGNDKLSFSNQLKSNPKLHKEIEQDRFNNFVDALGREYNSIDAFDNPVEQTKAWIIYDKLGSEGLTQYVNALQTSNSISATPEEKGEATEFLRNAKVGEETLNEYYQRFVVGEVKDTKYGKEIAKYAYASEIDPAILAGLVEQESSFNPNAVSRTGAVGLTQLQPATARENGLKVPDELYELDVKRINSRGAERDEYEKELRRRTKELGVDPENDERYNPEKALQATASYFQKSRKYFDDLDSIIASYHGGISGVKNAKEDSVAQGRSWRDFVDPDTNDYVTKVKERSVGYRDKVDGGLYFNPPTPNKELTTNTPKDLNNYNVDKFERDGTLKEFTSYAKTYVSENFPETFSRSFDVTNLKKDGEYSDEYVQMTQKVYQDAVESGKFEMEDLVQTLMGAKESVETDENGNPIFTLNYKSMNWEQRLAFDSLSHDNEFEYMMEPQGKGVYKYKPFAREEALGQWQDFFNFFQNTKKQYVKNEQGEFELVETADDGFWAGVQNTVATLGMGVASEVVQYGLTPLTRAYEWGMGSEDIYGREFVNDINRLSGIDPSADLTTSDSHGAFVAGVGEVAPFAMYMLSMFGLGRAALKGGAKIATKLTRSKKAMDTVKLGRVMSGSPKFAAMSQRLANGLQKKAGWLTGQTFVAGGAIKESLTPSERSFYNVVPQLFGYDQTNDLSTLYNNTGAVGKIGLDVVGSLALDVLADGLIASARFSGSKGMQRFFKKNSFDGIKWDGETNAWKSVESPEFKSEIREFYYNLTSDLAKKPMGDVGSTMAKAKTGKVTPETMHDVVKNFVDETGEFTSNIKAEIRSNLEHVQNKLGRDVKLTDEQLDELTEQQYGEFIKSTSEILTNTLKTSGDDSLPLRWAQAMEQQLPTVKVFKPDGKPINPQQMGAWKEKGYNLVNKDGEVYEVDGNFWGLDLATRMREDAVENINKEAIIEAKFRNANIDPKKIAPEKSDEARQIRERVNREIGTVVEVNGKVGYVTDFDDSGYKVRTADGIEDVSELTSSVDLERINREVIQTLSDEVLKTRMAMDMESVGRQVEFDILENLTKQTDLPQRFAGVRQQMESNADRITLDRINTASKRIGNLQRRLESLPKAIGQPEDSPRNVARRQISSEIEELKQNVRQRFDELEQIYANNEALARQRFKDVVDSKGRSRLIKDTDGIKKQKLKDFAEANKKVAGKQTKIPFC